MSRKLSVVRTYKVENNVFAVPKSWGREAVSKWLTKMEKREVYVSDVHIVALSEKKEFDDGLMQICQKIEREEFTVDDLPFELI